MKKVIVLMCFYAFFLNVKSQSNLDIEFLKKNLIQNKEENKIENIVKKLSTPKFWKLIGNSHSEYVEIDKANQCFYFSDDSLFVKCSDLKKNYGGVIADEITTGIWEYYDNTKLFTLNIYDKEEKYKLIRLNSSDLIIEDIKEGDKFFFSAQTDINIAPFLLRKFIENDKISAAQLKADWNKKGEEELNSLKSKIAKGYIFKDKELSVCPLFIGNPEDVLDYYKKSYSYKLRFGFDLIIHENGTISCIEPKHSKVDTTVLKILKFTIGKVKLFGVQYPVKSKIGLSFMERGVKDIPNSEITVLVKKKKKTPEYELISVSPPNKMAFVEKTINFKKILEGKDFGKYDFKINDVNVVADIFIYGCNKQPIINTNVVKSIIQFKPQNNYEWFDVQ